MNNKKGDIPIFVLVIGVVGICVLTIASFTLSIFTVSNSFAGVSRINTMNFFIEQYNFYRNFGKNFEEIENLFEPEIIKFDEKGNRHLFLEEKDLGSKVIFSVKYYLP